MWFCAYKWQVQGLRSLVRRDAFDVRALAGRGDHMRGGRTRSEIFPVVSCLLDNRADVLLLHLVVPQHASSSCLPKIDRSQHGLVQAEVSSPPICTCFEDVQAKGSFPPTQRRVSPVPDARPTKSVAACEQRLTRHLGRRSQAKLGHGVANSAPSGFRHECLLAFERDMYVV